MLFDISDLNLPPTSVHPIHTSGFGQIQWGSRSKEKPWEHLWETPGTGDATLPSCPGLTQADGFTAGEATEQQGPGVKTQRLGVTSF